MKQSLDIAIIGLSVMGRSLALNMADHGFLVGGYNRSSEVTKKVMAEHPHENLTAFYSLPDLVAALKKPRKIMLMIQAGAPVDAVIEQLAPLLDEGDFILDGGNSYYEDTNRRAGLLKERGLRYLGVGISGGEEGARFGPSIMPGGNPDAYEAVSPILEAIAAKAKGEPCCKYIGPDGAGHYVKMVHNGIEYGDMQLIAESYLLLKYAGGFTNREMAGIFRHWNEGELHSYLMGITADILQEPDDLSDGDLIDRILDSAGQKGTGRWASIESLKQGVDISMITAACNARVMSNHLERRKKASSLIQKPEFALSGLYNAKKAEDPVDKMAAVPADMMAAAPADMMAAAPADMATALPADTATALPADTANDKQTLAEMVRQALYTGKIIAYTQGFSLMQDASTRFNWNLDLGQIASIFRAGCIIQAEFLNDITRAYAKSPELESLIFDDFFLSRINRYQESLRKTVSFGVLKGLPIPAFLNAASYLDSFRADGAGANLIQAQRDFFGAHTFERTDREGVFHHEWRAGHEN